MLHGKAEPWLQQLIDGIDVQLVGLQSTDLERYCDYLDSDLAWNASYEFTHTWFDNWANRACKSETCPEGARCPYHQIEWGTIAEELNILLEAAIAAFCIGEERFVGRTMTVTSYQDVFERLNISESDPLLPLLLKLGKRGFVIGYQWSGYAEGIHGWLDPDETQELAQRLLELPLPQYPATFQAMDLAMETFRQSSQDKDPNYLFHELSLSFVRTVAVIASERQKGILWANDLINYPGYLPQHLNLDD